MSARAGHTLSELELARAGDLLVFNWLPALYAHDDWLGPWRQALKPQGRASRRMLCHASAALLRQQDLTSRHVSDVRGREWLLLPDDKLHAAAIELGTAMLGGWVRNGLQREDVARQRRILAPQQRANALAYSSRFKALPFPPRPWPLPDDEGIALVSLGASAMVALLHRWNDGAAQRVSLRFSSAMITTLALAQTQQEEAMQLLDGLRQMWSTPPGWLDARQLESLQ
jgi:hypothetical protein